MSKKKKTIIIVSIILVILLSFIGGKTFSKYITEIKGQGVADIARWHFSVNGNEEAMEIIELSSTASDSSIMYRKLAPGSNGRFEIIIDTTSSDVGVMYKIDFDEFYTKPTNLKFIYENNEYRTLDELETVLTGTIDANAGTKSKTLTIDWEWPYETGEDPETIAENDKIDTAEANTLEHYAFYITVTGTQVVPS